MISSARPSTTKPATSDASTTSRATRPRRTARGALRHLAGGGASGHATTSRVTALNAAGTPELDGTTLAQADDADDDSETPDVEGPLAFLASLLNAAAVTARAPAPGSGSGDGASHSAGNTAGNTAGGHDAMDDALGVCANPIGTAADKPDNAAVRREADGAPSPAAQTRRWPPNYRHGGNRPTPRGTAAARSVLIPVSGDAAIVGAARAAGTICHNLRQFGCRQRTSGISTPVRDRAS